MDPIVLTCPNCNGYVELDNNEDFCTCPFCGTKIQLNSKVKIEHTGSVSLLGLATVESLVRHAFMNVSTGDFERAVNSFQNALSLDPENIDALIGMMSISLKDTSLFFYQKATGLTGDFAKTEDRYLDHTTCHYFARAYAWASDFDRLSDLVCRYPECLSEVLLFAGRGHDIAQLLMQHIHSADEVFWMMGNNIDLDALEYLLSVGMNPNATAHKIPVLPNGNNVQNRSAESSILSFLFHSPVSEQKEHRLQGKEFACPLALTLGLFEGLVADGDRSWMEVYENLPLAKCLLIHGADPQKEITVCYRYSDDGATQGERKIVECATTLQAKELLKQYCPKKRKWPVRFYSPDSV